MAMVESKRLDATSVRCGPCAGPVTLQPWADWVQLQVADDVELSTTDGEHWRIASDKKEVAFRVDAATSAVLSRLCRNLWSLSTLAARLAEPDGAAIGTQIHRLWTGGVLTETIASGDRVLATLRPSRDVSLFPPSIDRETRLGLSEDACLRVDAGRIVFEALDYGAAVTLEPSTFTSVAGAFVESLSIDQIACRSGVRMELVSALVSLLAGIGVLREAGEAGAPPSSPHARGWAFADRLLHARSRRDRHVGGYGATFPLRQRLPEPPAIRPSRGGTVIDLPPVALADITRGDPPFTHVLETRRSIREIATHPLDFAQLGEFLYRTAHTTVRGLPDGREQRARPFPSAGGLFELDLYPLVHRCTGLAPGLYRYQGVTHALELVASPSVDTHHLLDEARHTAGMTAIADVLIVLAAYFPRVHWKYESMAYALILKDVGVLYQTMYLVATAMGLAPCALGGGSAQRFCEIVGADYWEESSVGEFLLSAREERSRSPLVAS
jgi:SagB-type dehydrogenase family enzyme